MQRIFYRFQNINDNVRFPPIYEVPASLREVNPSSFNPQVVSIGPLHKGRIHLKSEESKKPETLKELLLDVGSMEETLENCVKKVRGSIEEIRKYYFRMMPITDDELVEMMATGILLWTWCCSKTKSHFFVLQDLYGLTIQKLQKRPSFNKLLIVLLEVVNPFSEPLGDVPCYTEPSPPHHILHLLHDFFKPMHFDILITRKAPTTHSAVELDKVGVKFRPNRHGLGLMAVEFENSRYWHKPTLRIPAVCIDNFFEVVLRNLIAYEQHSSDRNYVRSYAMSMHILAGTPENISKLVKSGVIVSHFGSSENASDIVLSICKNIIFQDFHYMEWCTTIDKYFDSYWARNFKVFKRTYIDTPWKAIALFAAILVFVITVLKFFRQ
ncbi:hypothetical protein Hanom_Chr04g00323541 [Helianthus anomalus]